MKKRPFKRIVSQAEIQTIKEQAAASSEPRLQNKTITSNGTYNPPNGYDGFGKVVVNVPSPTIVLNYTAELDGSGHYYYLNIPALDYSGPNFYLYIDKTKVRIDSGVNQSLRSDFDGLPLYIIQNNELIKTNMILG